MNHSPAAEAIEFQRTFERVFGGFVTPTEIFSGVISGCVYREDGSKVDLSERFGGWKGDFFRTDNPSWIQYPRCSKQDGRGLYLGSLMAGHYGHFITEGLSTFWIFEKLAASEFDYFLFSPFVFGTKIPEYVLQCLKCFGIDPRKIVIMGNESLAFDELVVPERLLKLNHSADLSLRWVYQQIRVFGKYPSKSIDRIYLSRRKVGFKQLTRVIANEVLIEKIFQRAGFLVVYPEELPFWDQVGLYSAANVLAGPSGSAMHNSLFMAMGAQIIELGDPRYQGQRAPTQVVCDFVSGVKSILIPFEGKIRGDGNSLTVDIVSFRKHLIAVLNQLGCPTSDMPHSRVQLNALEWVEVLYLTHRPTARPWLSKLQSHFK